jgi:hypothetical protein
MKKRIRSAASRVAKNPVLQKSAQSLKPNCSIWGVLGVLIFFILPEIVGFIWGGEIKDWAYAQTLSEPSEIGRKVYWVLDGSVNIILYGYQNTGRKSSIKS